MLKSVNAVAPQMDRGPPLSAVPADGAPGAIRSLAADVQGIAAGGERRRMREATNDDESPQMGDATDTRRAPAGGPPPGGEDASTGAAVGASLGDKPVLAAMPQAMIDLVDDLATLAADLWFAGRFDGTPDREEQADDD
jgi:hypothetical protein